MARDDFPAFDPGPLFAVVFRFRDLHELDALLNELVHGHALFGRRRLLLAQQLADGGAALGLHA
jgi:hypothetical protein